MLSKRSLCVAGLIVLSMWINAGRSTAADPKPANAVLPVRVEPMLISQLGKEHFGNSVYRRGANGPRIVASGTRILEWPIQASAPMAEVFPNNPFRYSNGACAMDVNGDGVDEVVLGRTNSENGTDLLWFQEVPGEKTWKEHLIAKIPEDRELHDIMPFEAKVDGKLVRGVSTVAWRRYLYWYEIPSDVNQEWKKHTIADLGKHTSVLSNGSASQSGMVLGDIAGHGRRDLVTGNFWVECPADPTSDAWEVHRYSDWDKQKGEWKSMCQLDLADMDGDGKLDIVASEAEIPNSHVGVFCRDAANPKGVWKLTTVDTGIYCPHSLVVADVNADGHPDIIVGEMTAGGWDFPLNANPKLYLYLNQGNLKFKKYTIYSGWGIHMMRMVPRQPNDNNVFVFAADETQLDRFPDMTTHVVGWTISPAP